MAFMSKKTIAKLLGTLMVSALVISPFQLNSSKETVANAATTPTEQKAFPQAGKFTSYTTAPGAYASNLSGVWVSKFSQTSLNNDTIAYYKKWKEHFYRTYADQGHPEVGYIEGGITGGTPEWGSEPIVSASEHTGYGMIIFALMAGYPGDNGDAKQCFDSLVRLYYQLKRSNNLMCWAVPKTYYDVFKTKTITIKDPDTGKDVQVKPGLIDSATDGDFDIAYALLLAEKQWPGQSPIVGKSYLTLATDMINNGISNNLIDNTTFRVKLGDWHAQKGTDDYDKLYNEYVTRSSDFMIDNLKAFSQYATPANKTKIDKAVEECYSVLEDFYQNHNSQTGLLSDFISGNATDKAIPAPKAIYDDMGEAFPTSAYSENSCRLPQRLALDYSHSGSAQSKKYIDALNSFLLTKVGTKYSMPMPAGAYYTGYDFTKVRDGYKITGANIDFGTNHIGTHTGNASRQFGVCFAGAVTATSSTILSGGAWKYLISTHTYDTNTEDAYFKDTLGMLNILIASKNWWFPSK